MSEGSNVRVSAGEIPLKPNPQEGDERVRTGLTRAYHGSRRARVGGDGIQIVSEASKSTTPAQLLRDLGETQREVERLRAQISREAAERVQLLCMVSHELRTPVTVIRGYNNLLLTQEAGALTERQREFLEQSNRSCERLNRFIGDLLVARSEASDTQLPDLQHASLERLLVDVVASLQPLLDERDVKVELRIDRDASSAYFDPCRIEQVLTNLLTNAIRYSKSGASVCVRSRSVSVENHQVVEISVIDTGPGVAPEDRERIFEPYVRADDGSSGGLGLGLAICRRIVTAHGGSISVGDEPGCGSRFSFTLAAAESDESERAS